MITHIIGLLGSGKSLFATQKIIETLMRTDRHIYTNLRLKDFWDYRLAGYFGRRVGDMIKFLLSPFSDKKVYRAWRAKSYVQRYHYYSDPDDLVRACMELQPNKEHSRLFVWDEIQLEMNARECRKNNMDIVKFFSMSRKLGFDVLMVTQLKGALDRQVRDLADQVYELKNLANWKPLGFRIFPSFGLLSKHYSLGSSGREGKKGMFMGFEVVKYNSFYIEFYDTLSMLTKKDYPPPKQWSDNYSDSVICGNCNFVQFYLDNQGFVRDFKPDDYKCERHKASRELIGRQIALKKEEYSACVASIGATEKREQAALPRRAGGDDVGVAEREVELSLKSETA